MLARLTLGEPPGIIRPSMLPGITTPSHRPSHGATLPTLRDAARAEIHRVFMETQGNISETARRLGVSRNTIYRSLPKAASTPF